MIASVALLAGCGDGSGGPGSGSSVVGSPGLALTARQASCTDWREASVEHRGVMIEALRETEGRPTTGAVGATLPAEKAYDLLDRACANEYARAFKLYKVYARAAAFRSARP